jgi:lipopolysaccharide export system protein LptA
MHADTLFTDQIPYQRRDLVPQDSILVDSVWQHPAPDTVWVDTTYLQVRAYYNVRIFREDMQAVCDSVHYNGRDSIATLCGDPVCWNHSNQVSADTVAIYMKNGTVDYLHGMGNAIAIKQEGEAEFDQLAGKEMYAYVQNGDVYLVDVQGNAETVFYPREDDGSYVGVNKTQSSFVKLYLENRQIHHILFTSSTIGVMIPMSQATDEDKYLVTFFWAEQERPRKPGDVFLNPMRTPRPDASAVSASAEEEEEEEDEE